VAVMDRFKALGIRSILGERAILPSSAAANYLIPTPKTITTTKNSIISCNVVVRLLTSCLCFRLPFFSLRSGFASMLLSDPLVAILIFSAGLHRSDSPNPFPSPFLSIRRFILYQSDPNDANPTNSPLSRADRGFYRGAFYLKRQANRHRRTPPTR
jgi:hypothetical protein